jgi:uncharacterized repeat protein (TIGR03803 family)
MRSKTFLPFSTAVIASAAFFLTTASWATSQEKVLISFNPARGTYPSAELAFDLAGNLYGTTTSGGIYGLGTVFQLQPTSGGKWNTVVLHNFSGGADGQSPHGPLVVDGAGNLFGMTVQGGKASGNFGTVFEVSRSKGQWTETVIYVFKGGSDGAFPEGGLVFDKAGNLYGATSQGGGLASAGTVFELTPGKNGWSETVIHVFDPVHGDGRNPQDTLTMDKTGNLYGTTPGSTGIHGKVFELSPGSGGWTESILHDFPALDLQGGVVFDNNGNLFGTAVNGGRHGFGTVFELMPSTSGWTERTVHQFSNARDGGNPLSRLAFANGTLYGTASTGGAVGFGVLFQITLNVTHWQEKILHAFQAGQDGANPYAGVVLDGAGNLYGTTMFGGRVGQGIVFELTP